MLKSSLGQRHDARQPRSPWATLMTFTFLVPTLWTAVSAENSTVLNVQVRPQIANGVELRVLPIGDSITFGAQSTHGNGYRGELHDLLVQRGNKVNFVGGLATGSMADNSHEGHRAFVIDQISNSSTVGLHAAANIVLLHAGTNDMKNEVDPPNGPTRLKSLIDIIFENSPEAVVFVCQIIPAGPNKYRDALPRIDTFNAAIPNLISEYVSSGKKVFMVSMNKAVSTKDLADNLHPNDIGYTKMANEYYAAIEEADARDWISAPGQWESDRSATELAQDLNSAGMKSLAFTQFGLTWVTIFLISI
ncbi:FG-GAP repeat domain-containing protein [Verticillium alfalfae VaMs.102]|uniref:FG-GAP repeat domain-containing protein n=1 Tax=Verticillium alfalfae (strain VaMs.102 / ATCC MYA-4576 / FGSC 10136) TaxID=526221 RepID=C9SEL1_VERA1|nr:FG-GAP repeat domain-containing protein [Verticillium alfalfae VaMs.102]EEY16604.1 FG-GAP repeat domain-containing protein [Verticillium alfalfae VaMs.102]